MKMIAGEFSRAIRNSSRTIRGPSPKYFCTNSDPLTRMKLAVVLFATAFTSMVFPVPGGPYNKTPRGGSIPARLLAAFGTVHLSLLTNLLVKFEMGQG